MIQKENATKEERVRIYLAQKGYDFLLLTRPSNFAWITCGGSNRLDQQSVKGVASILLGKKGERFVFAHSMDWPRLKEESVAGLGFESRSVSGSDGTVLEKEVRQVTGSGRILSDGGEREFDRLPEDFWALRYPLLSDEIVRYRSLGYDLSGALLEAVRSVGPGFKEYEIAAIVAASCLRRKIGPCVNLVAAEGRIDRLKRPPPREEPFQDRLMIKLSGERDGLVASMTRFLYRYAIPRALDRKHESVARIDAAAIAASRPGRTLGQVLERIEQAYGEEGFAEGGQNGPQGGITGYECVDRMATRQGAEILASGHALAWNPALPGVQSQDTVLVTDKGFEILTRGEEWTYLPVTIEGMTVDRPWPLVI